MKYSIKTIQQQFDATENSKFLFFWGHTPSQDGSITKSCLSQWWQAPFRKENETYRTAEHFMMAEKARLFWATNIRKEILASTHPAEAKKMGRKVKGFDAKVWDEHKYGIVKEANLLKFSQHTPLRDFLANTGSSILVEASPVDNIWGIGLAKDDPKAQNPHLWEGENLLGFALMEVRDQLI